MIKAIIFDFDGVLINEFEKHYELSTKQIVGITREELKDLFMGNVHEMRDKLKDRDTGYPLKEEFNKYKSNVLINESVKESLFYLKDKFILGIISSALENGTIDCLKKNDLENLFSFVYGFETDSKKDIKFNLAMEKFNLKPEEIIFVTDTVGDILEARKVEIKSIAVDFGYHEKERLEIVKPIKIVSSFKELEKFVEEIRN